MKIKPMAKDFVLYRCIHVGPLSPKNIDELTAKNKRSTKKMFTRNKKFFERIIEAYGSCAMLALENEEVIAHTRFYPLIISELTGQENMCCQQPEYAPTQRMVEMDLPSFEKLKDRTLKIYC